MVKFALKDFNTRKRECDTIRQKYPDKIPVIVQKVLNTDIPDIDKNKFLVPSDLTVAQFLYTIRKRLALRPDQSLFLFVNNTLPPSQVLLSELYHIHKSEDGFLYINYSGETTFG